MDVQISTVADYLCVKNADQLNILIAELPWELQAPLDRDDIIARILHEAENDDPAFRWSLQRVLKEIPSDLRESVRLSHLVDTLN